MKTAERIGMLLVLSGLAVMLLMFNIHNYRLTENGVNLTYTDSAQKGALLSSADKILNVEYNSKFTFSKDLKTLIASANEKLAGNTEAGDSTAMAENADSAESKLTAEDTAKNESENKGTVDTTSSPQAAVAADKNGNDATTEADSINEDSITVLMKNSVDGPLKEHNSLFLLLVIGLFATGSIIFSFARYLSKPAGINNDKVFQRSISAKGIVAVIVGVGLILFYVALYWYPYLMADLVKLVDPLSYLLNGGGADEYFLYGIIYSFAILLLGIKMFLKYRHSVYQKIRTLSVTFFQLSFAFIIPEILKSLNKPSLDLKNIWPLDYSFFWNNNIGELISNGKLGFFMLIWGLILLIIIVPLFTYFFGKRWYCSWVCGCGGLAETAGDPFRHLSSKKIIAWKIERILIYSVLVIITLVTAITLINYFSHEKLLGSATAITQEWYGFLIGSVFAGVIGTGLYPFMGSRVWCRFGCPLSAIFGIIQRYKSRFRITTNGGQCISCGNCSTYCEMGIDVRAYAQKGQNIVRASCVGCGICAEVCPRGVLKLENGNETGRINNDPIIIGNNRIEVKM